jgi:hypothetical protein
MTSAKASAQNSLDYTVVSASVNGAMDHAYWSLPLTAAWIIWRNTGAITLVFWECQKQFSVAPHVFDVFDQAMRTSSADPPHQSGKLDWSTAQMELWEKLQNGALQARGIRVGQGVWSQVPKGEWVTFG